MFAYQPTTNDNSGAIMAAGQLGAAQANSDMMQGIGEDIGGAIASLAGSYAENKAMDAKGEAYGQFLKMHGTQLGLDPTYLDDLLKKPNRQIAMIGDSVVGIANGNMANRLMSLNYMNEQAKLWPRKSTGVTPITPGVANTGGQPYFTMPGS